MSVCNVANGISDFDTAYPYAAQQPIVGIYSYLDFLHPFITYRLLVWLFCFHPLPPFSIVKGGLFNFDLVGGELNHR